MPGLFLHLARLTFPLTLVVDVAEQGHTSLGVLGFAFELMFSPFHDALSVFTQIFP